MLIGYARISTGEQILDLQLDALKAADCDRVFTDTMSGAKADRPGLAQAIAFARTGDTLVVWRLDRLGRSLQHLIQTITDLQESSIGFRSLNESIDTTTPSGKLIFHIFGALAEFEREIIRERTNAGLVAARARGRVGGRKSKLTPKQVELAKRMHADKNNDITTICQTLGISRSTLYRLLRQG